jgi:hypothetical protein
MVVLTTTHLGTSDAVGAPSTPSVSAYEGGNRDHDAVNALSGWFLDEISVLAFAEYNFFDGKWRAQEFPYPNGAQTVIVLAEAEQARKHALLKLYTPSKTI